MSEDNPSGKKLPSRRKFMSLIDESHATKKKTQSASGALGDSIRQSVDKDGLHAGAFKLMAKLDRMDERARDEYLDAVDAYRDFMEQERWSKLRHTGDFADMAEGEGDGDGGEKPKRAGRKPKPDGMPSAKPRSPAAEAAKDMAGEGDTLVH
jgi:hypothetical protein